MRYTVGPKGTRVTTGIPGTGLSWTEYTPHGKRSSVREADALPPPQEQTSLIAIESAPAEKINELSTSELAPILNVVQRRARLAPSVVIACLGVFTLAFHSNDPILMGLTAIFAAISIPMSYSLDRYRRSVRIDYKTDGAAGTISEVLSDSFTDLKNCSHVWSIREQGGTSDWKKNAGATTLTKRERIFPESKRPSCIRGRASFPTIALGTDELYFLPDAILLVKPKSVAALHYPEFAISLKDVRFVEEERLPSDAKIIGQTWRYVNKKGGPDRRFIGNRQIPICLYGEISLASPGGLTELSICRMHPLENDSSK